MDIVIHISLALLVLVTLYPVLHILAVSISSGTAIAKNIITFYPVGLQFNAYKLIFQTARIPRAFKNSVIYTSLGTFINLVLTITMAYPLSKKRLTLRGFYTTLVVITMFFGGGLIPTFILVNSLGMYNTIWAMVIPGAIATWNLIIMRTFFQALPVELEESAYLDGAKDMTILLRIVLPLSKAAIATIGLFYLVAHWNSWFAAVIYLKQSSRYPLQVILREIVIQGRVTEELVQKGMMSLADQTGKASIDDYISLEKIKYATLFVSIVPMLIIYPFIQKYFVKGVMIGSLKG
jgi:putative aldouronate transport system permease protein